METARMCGTTGPLTVACTPYTESVHHASRSVASTAAPWVMWPRSQQQTRNSEPGTGAGPSRQWHWSHRMTDTSLVYQPHPRPRMSSVSSRIAAAAACARRGASMAPDYTFDHRHRAAFVVKKTFFGDISASSLANGPRQLLRRHEFGCYSVACTRRHAGKDRRCTHDAHQSPLTSRRPA